MQLSTNGRMIGAGIFVLMGQFVELIGICSILVAQRLFMVTHTDGSGSMHMEKDGIEMKVM